MAFRGCAINDQTISPRHGTTPQACFGSFGQIVYRALYWLRGAGRLVRRGQGLALWGCCLARQEGARSIRQDAACL